MKNGEVAALGPASLTQCREAGAEEKRAKRGSESCLDPETSFGTGRSSKTKRGGPRLEPKPTTGNRRENEEEGKTRETAEESYQSSFEL